MLPEGQQASPRDRAWPLRPRPEEPRRRTLLVVRHNGLGDVFAARPALLALRRHFPSHEIRTTCPSWLAPLVGALSMADAVVTERGLYEDTGPIDPSCHEDADEGILRNLFADASLADVVVVLRVPEERVLRGLLAKRPSHLIAFRHPFVPETARSPSLDYLDHILVRWQRLLGPSGIAVDQRDLRIERVLPPPRERGHTVVHVGAGSQARCWPVDRWSEVVAALEGDGHKVVLTGSAAERPVAASVRRRAGLPAGRNTAGRTDVLAMADLAAGARVVLSTDTGVAHLAYALGRPSVTLFGPTPPAWWGPPPGAAQHLTIWKGRHGDAYSSSPDPGLLAISVGEVLEAVRALVR